MKHIKNSVSNSILLLEHAGVPVAIQTDFSENIKDGSLCVDTTNQDLYILRNKIWVKMGSGFNQDDWIPRKGTTINKPVYGDIEIVDGIKIFSGQSGITFSDSKLILSFSDNDLNISDNFSLLLNRNVILQKNSSALSIDSASTNNFINKITTGSVTISNSSENLINTNIIYAADLSDFNNNTIHGNIQNQSQFSDIINSNFKIYSSPRINFLSGSNNNFILTVEQSNTFTVTGSTKLNLKGVIYGSNSTFQNISNSYLEGSFKNSLHYDSNHIHFYGNESDILFSNNSYIYNLGHITGNEAGILTGGSSTSSKILNSTGIYNLGALGAIKLIAVENITFLGNNTNIVSNNANNNVLLNNNGYSIIESTKNFMYNNENKLYTTSRNFSKLEQSSYNILFNNNEIHSTSSNFNFIVNTENININGDNNFIFTPKEISNGFKGKILGSNNVIFSLKPNIYTTLYNNVFTFGDISTTSGLHIYEGNVILGNIDLNSSLTTNNQIFGAKRLKDINHSGQINNIFLNVDNFNVPDSNTVYLPEKFYGINLGNYGLFNLSNITGNQYWNFPDKSGTVALVGDIPSGGVDKLVQLKDVNISNVQNQDFLVYNLASTSWINKAITFGGGGTNGVIQTTYNNLYSMSTAGLLESGKYYQFDYQTIHIIPYTTELHYGAIEKLVVLAISNTQIDYLAHSLSESYDIIHYRLDDRYVNSGSTYYLPLTPKPGMIYFREDTRNRLSAPYDFREVTYRRWEIQHPYVVTSSTKTFQDNENLLLGDVIVDNTGIIYIAKFTFQCSTTDTPLNNTHFFYNFTDVLDNSYLSSVNGTYKSKHGTNFCSPTPNNFVFVNNTGSSYSDIVLSVNNNSYHDFKTFDNVFKNVGAGISYKSYNCHIKNYIPAYYESVPNEYYPNIVMTDFCNNITVGQLSENITIIESSNLNIGDYGVNMFINTYNSSLNHTDIGARCENIFIQNTYGNDFVSDKMFHKIGISNKNIINYNVANIDIGNKNASLYMFYSQSCTIGNINKFIGYFGKNGPICKNNNLKDYNSDISYSFNTYNNTIGNNNSVIILPVSAYSNIIEDDNNNINGYRINPSSIEGVLSSNINNNIVGSNNNNIYLAGSGNTYGNNISDLYCDVTATYNNCTFKNRTGNLNIISSIIGSSFGGTTFEYERNIFSGILILDIDNQTRLNNMNFNMPYFGNSTTSIGGFVILDVMSPTTELILLNLV